MYQSFQGPTHFVSTSGPEMARPSEKMLAHHHDTCRQLPFFPRILAC